MTVQIYCNTYVEEMQVLLEEKVYFANQSPNFRERRNAYVCPKNPAGILLLPVLLSLSWGHNAEGRKRICSHTQAEGYSFGISTYRYA